MVEYCPYPNSCSRARFTLAAVACRKLIGTIGVHVCITFKIYSLSIHAIRSKTDDHLMQHIHPKTLKYWTPLYLYFGIEPSRTPHQTNNKHAMRFICERPCVCMSMYMEKMRWVELRGRIAMFMPTVSYIQTTFCVHLVLWFCNDSSLGWCVTSLRMSVCLQLMFYTICEIVYDGSCSLSQYGAISRII